MALNPMRDPLRQSGLRAVGRETPFQAEADTALAAFRALRADLERQVRRGDLTPKVARLRAVEAASALRDRLARQAEGFSPAPRAFLDRLIDADSARRRAREHATAEGLQRETIRLLRQLVVEQQVAARATEFEGVAFVRPVAGGAPAPTLESLLAFHEQADRAGDEAAREWTRRQLEAMRPRVLDDEGRHRIDRATDRPGRVNPRTVARYVEALGGQPAEQLEAFVAEALAARDASACAAAFVLAREAPEGPAARWARAVLDGLQSFPDDALATLRAWEAEARRLDAEAARTAADYAAAAAEADARLAGVEPPSAAELDRMDRLRATPAARPDEPIGLALGRRGLLDGEAPPVDAGD